MMMMFCVFKLTVVAAVPGQPFPFGTVGSSDDADDVAAIDGQIILASLGRHGYFCLVHGILLSCDLLNRGQVNTTHMQKYIGHIYTICSKVCYKHDINFLMDILSQQKFWHVTADVIKNINGDCLQLRGGRAGTLDGTELSLMFIPPVLSLLWQVKMSAVNNVSPLKVLYVTFDMYLLLCIAMVEQIVTSRGVFFWGKSKACLWVLPRAVPLFSSPTAATANFSLEMKLANVNRVWARATGYWLQFTKRPLVSLTTRVFWKLHIEPLMT